MVTVIGFYTPEYAADADLLKRSLAKVGMDGLICPVASRGDWDDNTAFKAEFIRTMRHTLAGKLLYVDADAFVHENCQAYFEGLEADFGAHWFRGPAYGHDQSQVQDEGHWLLSGTLFFNDTGPARDLVDLWVGENRKQRKAGERSGGGQKNLWRIHEVWRHGGVSSERLPGSYTWVFDKPWAYADDERPIIEHTIASRSHRPGAVEDLKAGRLKRVAELEAMV
jgi:hypothetical protein